MASPPLTGSASSASQPVAAPEIRGKLAEAEQIARYLWASKLVAGCRVLDAGCGTGYGCTMLSAGEALEVVGVDPAEAVLEVAAQSAPDNVRYEVGDISGLPFDAGSFERVVCFETIEQVDDPDAVLDELKRVLAPGGVLIVSSSVPASYLRANEQQPHRFTPAELRAGLEARFKAVRLVQQHLMLASVMAERLDAGTLPRPSVSSTAAAAPGSETHTLALAGDCLPDTSIPIVTLSDTIELREILGHAGRQDAVIRGFRELRAELEDARGDRQQAIELLAQREQELAQLPALAERVQAAEAELHAQHGILTGQIDEQDARIADLGAELERTRSVLESFKNSISWRITAPLRRLKRPRPRG